MAAVAVKCTGLNFRSCFDDLYSNHLQLFAIARPFDPPGFERSQQVDRDNLPDSLDVSFEFTNGDMDPIINSTYCYGTGGSGASGGSPHANWHGDHEFTADVSMTLSFTCEFETQSGICCLPSGSVSATRKECGELCGIYFSENDQSAICPDVQTPTQKQCSDTKPGEKWYPTNAGTLTTDDRSLAMHDEEECIISGCSVGVAMKIHQEIRVLKHTYFWHTNYGMLKQKNASRIVAIAGRGQRHWLVLWWPTTDILYCRRARSSC